MKIKTRESLKTIKTFDRVENLAGKTKTGISELNKGAEETQRAGYTSGTEYAGNQVRGAEKTGTRNALYGANRAGRWGVKETRRNIRRWKSRQKKPILSKQKELPAPKWQMLSAPKTADKTAKGAKTAQKTAKATLKASQKVAQAAKVAAKATVHGIKVAGKVTVVAVKATVAAVKGIVAAIAAGGWMAVLIIVIGVIFGFVIGSVFAIFTPNTTGDSVTIQEVMNKIERDYDEKKEELIENISFDVLLYEGKISDWKEVLAVSIVKLNFANDSTQEFTVLDDNLIEKIETIFFDMNELTTKIDLIPYTSKRTEVDDDGTEIEIEETKYMTYLTVISTPKTAIEMAYIYGFSDIQITILEDLLQENSKIRWKEILKYD